MNIEKEELKITGTDDFDFSTLQQYAQLKKLNIDNCPLLTCLPELPASLINLYFKNCPLLIRFPELPATLTHLICFKCPLITALPELPATLTDLHIEDFSSLVELPDLHHTQLTTLRCINCPLLTKIYPSFDIKDINTINQFRICYYTEKYGKRILKRHKELRFNKYKQELMETSLRIYLHPNRICSLLESGLFTWGDLHLVV